MGAPAQSPSKEPSSALQRGVDALLQMQRADGSWEGECVWCPMLTAQYAISSYIIGFEVPATRRRGMLQHFRATQNDAGAWGLHPYDEGSLFVTTLVYVAARILGAQASEPWLRGAQQLFEREGGVQRIPTWGKVWLALLGLYDWDGIHPILPELWALPARLPLHPGNYYCHTRAIYLGLAVLYGERFAAPSMPLTEALRHEIYPRGYSNIDFAAQADQVRELDAPFRPSVALRLLYRLARRYERVHSRRLRNDLLDELRDVMRRDLRASDYLSLSPVNGLLSMIALWAEDPSSPDLRHAVARFEAWFWEDTREGSRVAGAGSVCWDTSFALQALSSVPTAEAALATALGRGARFLATQQMGSSNFDYAAAHRIDPDGGWCFSERGHGWPVSDCTAEAALGLLHARPHELGREDAARAVRFILRCQNHDGGFGSYEPAKTRVPLEWMNPAEMFGRCMTERSYVECTASCMMALREVRARYPDLMRRELRDATKRAMRFLVDSQREDGTWEAAWGVRYVYSTMFGVRGLLAAGISASDERVRRACRWLLDRQRQDGGWGERQPRDLSPEYFDAGESSPVQTAWALTTLVEAAEPDDGALERASDYLESSQLASGQWPDGEFVGVFFETALLNYRLYRQYFPVQALALYERHRTARTE